MNANNHEVFPLFAFFESLRRNDFLLGVRDFEIFLKAFQKKYGLSPFDYSDLFELTIRHGKVLRNGDDLSRDGMFELAKLLWLKPYHSLRAFEDLYLNSFGILETKNIGERTFSNIVHNELPVNDTDNEPLSDSDHSMRRVAPPKISEQSVDSKPPGNVSQNVTVRIAAGNGYYQDSVKIDNLSDGTIKRNFLFTSHYYPIDTRKIEQIFRLLPTHNDVHFSKEIDVDLTIESIVKNGGLPNIIYRRKKQQVYETILLIDHLGSMVAFKSLSNIIKEKMERTIASGRTSAKANAQSFYFYNAPTDYLYHDTTRTKYSDIDKIIGGLKGKNIFIVIISDGGAARGNLNLIRLEATRIFLSKLKKYTNKVVWLNPMPKERWDRSSAEVIASRVAMFEANESGIRNAVCLFKGTISSKVINDSK